jgi:hypothetical protein
MFADVYIGLVKSENFDYEKPGSPYGYSRLCLGIAEGGQQTASQRLG